MYNLELSSGETLDLQELIDAIEKAPNEAEILQGLEDLRREKVKEAAAQTIRAAQFDRRQISEDYIAERQSENTRRSYRQALGRFFSWADREGLHVLQVRRPDLIRFRDYLQESYSSNTARHTIAVLQGFYTYLESLEYITRNPSVQIPLPRKEWKKRIKQEAGETIPVMNETEYWAIVETYRKRKQEKGKQIYVKRRRESAARLLPAIQFMGLFGLRVGDLPSVKIDGDSFSYAAKGGNTHRRQAAESWDPEAATKLLRSLRKEPFKDLRPGTVQVRLKQLTKQLTGAERIRYPYTAHDLRHFFARMVYSGSRDVYQVKRYLGHSSIAVTETYLQQIGAK
jgi:site-specific recombinase XerD